MNTYHKFAANVFVAKSTDRYQKDDTITLTTKYGKEHECIVHNCVGKDAEGNFYYSITRADGYNCQERAKAKAERLQGWASNAEKRSTAYYEASHEGKDFLALGEPIKIGHHSEKRHRAMIERNWNRMGKSVEESKKVAEYEQRAEYWEAKAEEVNLSMPESIELWEYKLEAAKDKHAFLKENPDKRPHGMSLQYATKELKEAEKNLKIAQRLWA
jgi:hypothetical protein